jgi:hypothetical protein
MMAIRLDAAGSTRMATSSVISGAVHDGHRRCGDRGRGDGHRIEGRQPDAMAIFTVSGAASRDGHAPSEDTLDRVAVYGLSLSARSIAHRPVRDAVDIT